MGTTQLHVPKLALILRIYQECDRREGDNKEVRVLHYEQTLLVGNGGEYGIWDSTGRAGNHNFRPKNLNEIRS